MVGHVFWYCCVFLFNLVWCRGNFKSWDLIFISGVSRKRKKMGPPKLENLILSVSNRHLKDMKMLKLIKLTYLALRIKRQQAKYIYIYILSFWLTPGIKPEALLMLRQ